MKALNPTPLRRVSMDLFGMVEEKIGDFQNNTEKTEVGQ